MSKKPILLLHGALGSKQQFTSFEQEMSIAFQVHSFTFEGHGGVASNRPFSINHFVENVLQFMNEKGIERIDIFGYSMGGYVALLFAQKYPERIGRIVTLGTKFDWTPAFAEMEVPKLNPAKIAEKVPRFAQFLEKVHSPLDWKEVVTNTANMMIELGNERPLEKHYSTIAASALIVLGSLDNMSTEEESKLVAEKLPNGRFQLLPDSEHAIEKVDYQYLSKIIQQFVSA